MAELKTVAMRRLCEKRLEVMLKKPVGRDIPAMGLVRTEQPAAEIVKAATELDVTSTCTIKVLQDINPSARENDDPNHGIL